MKIKNTDEKIQIQIASVMDDCGSNEILTIEMTRAQEKTYNECIARLAELWG